MREWNYNKEYVIINYMNEQNQSESLEQLLLKMYENTEKTRKYIMWGRIMSLIYLILIMLPLILAVIYLPPLIQNIMVPYQELLGSDPKATKLLQQINNLQNSGLNLEELMK